MEKRKIEKITILFIGVVVVIMSIFNFSELNCFGIYSGCNILNRLLYPFFHANIVHATLNVWCLLSLVFLYDISIWRLMAAYIFAISIPVDTLALIISSDFTLSTVGLSGVVFFLFGSISFEVARKAYYQMWMIAYIGIGFIHPNTNAWLHIYCYILGVGIALFSKPINISK